MPIFDVCRGHTTEKVTNFIEENDFVVLHVPHNMTNYFQMLDLHVNGHAKEFLRKKFEEWYSFVSNCRRGSNKMHQGANYQDFLKSGGCFWVIIL